jgi:threonine synthase
MCGFEAEGSAAIVYGKIVKEPNTIATAIRIGNPASWKEAEAAARDSGGGIDFVSDEQILDAYKLVAQSEGIFCEPSSAASLAGLIKNIKAGKVKADSDITVVCVLTGNGLKDPDTAIKVCAAELKPIPPTLVSLREAMKV